MLLRHWLPLTLQTLFLIAGIIFETTETGMPRTMFAISMFFCGLGIGFNWDGAKKYVNSVLDTPVIKEEKREN